MLERIRTTLQTKCLLDRDRLILVGISGGPDSLCLLDALHRLGYHLIMAHLDHGLRQESASEAEAARMFAQELGIPFLLGREEVGAFAEENRLSLEEAARLSRYRFLFRQAEIYQAQAVAVGHTADDQVETVLMHLLRGAGLPGLSGIAYRSLPNTWSQSIPLVRPLLEIWREEILAYLEERGLHPSLDASNLDTRFYRNRLRNQVIPYLESVHPHIRENLWRTAELLREDAKILENLVDVEWRFCVLDQGPNYLALSPGVLLKQPLALQRHLLRRGIGLLRPGLRDVDFKAIQRAIQFLETPSRSGKIDLVAGLYLTYEEERLWLAAWEADLPNAEWPQVDTHLEYKLEAPGEVLLEGDWRMVAKLVNETENGRTQAFANVDPLQAWLDLDSLQLPLAIRCRRPGDRIQPLGMRGSSVKVADLMVNLKLPRRARDGWPLVLSGEEIAWIPGARIGQRFRVRDNTDRMLRIQLLSVPLSKSTGL